MRKTFLTLFILFFSIVVFSQKKDEREILAILENQTKAWNNGDLDRFMIGYLKSDSLMYIGKAGVTYGYNATLDRYKKNYAGPDNMGKLRFDILHLKPLGPNYYMVVGKWYLTRKAGDVGGHYTLIFEKQHGEWLIIADHSS
jgi:hypothetical protein